MHALVTHGSQNARRLYSLVCLVEIEKEDTERVCRVLAINAAHVLSSESTGIDHFEDWRRKQGSSAPLDILHSSHEQRTKYLP